MQKFRVLSWTQHAKMKMEYYRLSPARVRRVLHSPKRVEEGVAPKTVAVMQPASLKTAGAKSAHGAHAGQETQGTWTQEIWVMIQDTGKDRRVISAWRYPGVTKPRATADFIKKEYNEFVASASS